MRSFILSFLLLSVNLVFAQAGYLDSTFNSSGFVNEIYYTQNSSTGILQLNTGEIIVIGNTYTTLNSKPWIIALKDNGTLDSNFNNDGKYIFNNQHSTFRRDNIKQHPQGKIFLAGSTSFSNQTGNQIDLWICRLTKTGLLEKEVLIDIYDYEYPDHLLIQNSGRLLLVTQNGLRKGIIALTYNLKIDSTFGNNGLVITHNGIYDYHMGGADFNSNEDIFLASASNTGVKLFKYSIDGQPDSTFGTNGQYVLSPDLLNTVTELKILPDDRMLIFGEINYQGKIICLQQDGTVDTSFKIIDSIPAVWGRLLLQQDGKFLIHYEHNDSLRIMRYDSHAKLDSSFGNNGRAEVIPFEVYVSAAAMQQDGKILVTGMTGYPLDVFVARYHSGINIGIDENNLINSNVVFFPNPVKNQARLRFTLLKHSALDIFLIDMLGRHIKVIAQKQNFNGGENEIHINGFQNLPDGTYFVQLFSGTESVSIPVLKTSD